MWRPVKNFIGKRAVKIVQSVRLDKIAEIVAITEEELGSSNPLADEQSKWLFGTVKKNRAVDLLNNVIDIPYVPEWAEELIFGFLVDMMVRVFNQFVWKKEPK